MSVALYAVRPGRAALVSLCRYYRHHLSRDRLTSAHKKRSSNPGLANKTFVTTVLGAVAVDKCGRMRISSHGFSVCQCQQQKVSAL
jgi:hypothetical protein